MSKLRTLGWIVVTVGAIAGLARLTIFDVWTIADDGTQRGISIEPSISAGDTVLMYTRGTPGFGDLVRCTDPQDPSGYVIGRIAGLYGDTVEVNGRDLVVDGKRYIGEMVCPIEAATVIHPVSGEKITLACDQVMMGSHIHYRGYSPKAEIRTPTKTTVGMGMVFLLSDNRSFHDDSRDYGVVPQASCNRHIVFRLWSKGGWGDEKHRLSYIR